jgi:predicted Zn-dependent protease
MNEIERELLAAQGYAELGMFQEALEELRKLPLSVKEDPEVLEMELLILMQLKAWKEALGVSKRLCRAAPEAPIAFIHAAFCLHELGRTDEAKMALLNGPHSLENDPTFHYNLACYECILGELESAKRHLNRSFSMDKKFREFAKTDPDLAPLRRAL